MADNTISPVVPNVSGGRNVSTGQKAVTQTAAQSGIDFKSYLGGRTAVQDNSTTFLKRRNSYTLNKNNTKEISIKTASKNSPTESEVKKITDDISSQIVEKVTDDLDISEDELNNAMQLLGLTAMDLLNPANLSALYCEVTGNASDPQALVLNADFTALFNDVSQVASENDAQLDLLSQLTASDDGEILDADIVSSADTTEKKEPSKPQSAQELKFVRILYKTLLDNEVDEKYINQILDEIEKFLRPGNSLDVILSNVYQKLILRFGQPETIKVNGKKPRVVFFVGPTGVGKTTTIAKIASKFKVNYNKNIAFITADTYRIAATDQLRTFANILDTPLSVIYTATELNSAVAEYEQADVIFVDTAGFSHKNETQRNDMRALLAGLSPEYEKSVYLVLSATTKYRDLISIIDSYKDIDDYKLIFTKLDETSSYGNLLNIKLYSDAGISYVTNGQNVPDDIEVFDTQKIVKQLLGGRQ